MKNRDPLDVARDTAVDQMIGRAEDRAPELPSVAGRMEMAHPQFQRACQAALSQSIFAPGCNNHLVYLLCEAVRCSRECCEIAGGSETKAEMDRLRAELHSHRTALVACRDALQKIYENGRWSADVTTGLLGPERDGPWCLVDHKHIKTAITLANSVLK